MMALPPVRPRDLSVVLCKEALPVTCEEEAGLADSAHPPGRPDTGTVSPTRQALLTAAPSA